jgi:hypothetical protein
MEDISFDLSGPAILPHLISAPRADPLQTRRYLPYIP